MPGASTQLTRARLTEAALVALPALAALDTLALKAPDWLMLVFRLLKSPRSSSAANLLLRSLSMYLIAP